MRNKITESKRLKLQEKEQKLKQTIVSFYKEYFRYDPNSSIEGMCWLRKELIVMINNLEHQMSRKE